MAELQEAEVTEQLESPPAQQTAGSLLRQAREAAGMHVSSLADVLKVPVAKLQALEADDWQALPDAVFTRSVALSICKALQVDAAPVMALLPKSAATQKFTAPGPGINEPFRDKAVRSVHDTPNPGGAWKWLALALLAGAGGGVWYFAQKQDLRDAVVASVQERSERAMGTSQSAHTVDVAPPEAPAAEPVAAQEPVAPAAAEAAAPAVAAVQCPLRWRKPRRCPPRLRHRLLWPRRWQRLRRLLLWPLRCPWPQPQAMPPCASRPAQRPGSRCVAVARCWSRRR